MREIFEIAEGLSCISRYSQSHLIKEESVLEHTGFVALFSYSVCARLISHGEKIDIGKLLSRAVVHDIDEVITGDIPRPTKYDNSSITSELRKLEEKNMKILSKRLVGCACAEYSWLNSKLNDKEGFIIRFADSVAVLWKARHEGLVLGNSSLTNHVSSVYKLLESNKLEELALELFDNHGIIMELINESKELCLEVIENES